MPEHDRAFDNGCVYEHILVAEEILGRRLNDGECVHYKDLDRTNNSKDNLMIFKTISDHTSFHNGSNIHLDGDVWVAEHINNICPLCNKNNKSLKAEMCMECSLKERALNIPSKDEVENLIYKMPFTKIGELYGVSDNAVRKWCKKYNLPFRRSDINNAQK